MNTPQQGLLTGELQDCEPVITWLGLAGMNSSFFGLGSRADTAEKDESVLRQRLVSLTTGRFDIGYQSIEYPGASVGLIRAGSGDRNIDGLLKRADAAMYAVKRNRRSRGQV
ncbi:hypothetical protein [Halomonas sp. BC04]|uniref:hypothetical protein n=1 Tax=Halomonas sp. BC04 TaxID=1403540 RepID=UPI0003ED7203|nr:hypothetical protein [Halomonas sp. BC04]EWG97919.1 hypothetical protein Q427_33400 [Halomonas sp. BC04]